ncbi:MAG TPA: hypothetical protein VG389_21890 [Myxococcota bacterium]|nr:hypothetical protein [Myxococcota bacterium]
MGGRGQLLSWGSGSTGDDTLAWTGLDVTGSCLDYDRAVFVAVILPGPGPDPDRSGFMAWYVNDDD